MIAAYHKIYLATAGKDESYKRGFNRGFAQAAADILAKMEGVDYPIASEAFKAGYAMRFQLERDPEWTS